MKKFSKFLRTGLLVVFATAMLTGVPNLWAADANWPKQVAVMGGAPGSTYYSCNTALGEILKKYMQVDTSVMASGGGSAPAISAIGKGEADIAIGSDSSFYAASVAVNEYKGKEKIKNLRCIAQGYTLNFPWVARVSSGINKIEDIRGKTAYIEIQTSKIHKTMNALIAEAYGLVPDKDFKSVKFAGQEEVMSALGDGRADVGSYAELTPTSYYLELADRVDIKFLSFSKEAMDYVIKRSDAYIPTTIPGGVYKGNDKPVATLGIMVGYYGTSELPEGFVYQLTKLFYEEPSRSDLISYSKALEQFSLDRIPLIKTPFHKGTIRYYKEKGAWTPEMQKKQDALLAEIGVQE